MSEDVGRGGERYRGGKPTGDCLVNSLKDALLDGANVRNRVLVYEMVEAEALLGILT